MTTTEQESTEDAAIFLQEPAGGWRWLLDKEMAGVPPLQRLIFSIGRAGIKRVLVVCRGLDPAAREKLETGLKDDFRCRASVRVADANDQESLQNFINDGSGSPVVLAAGNAVTTPKTVKRFLEDEYQDTAGSGMRRVPAAELQSSLRRFAEGDAVFDTRVDAVAPSGGFLELVDAARFRQVEKHLLDHYRHHYTQLMDVYFNSHFSIPISSLLVRLPVTPNQVTLMGLGIGALAGWFFSRGDYWSGVLGGLLLAFTAIWDCCDGDVARLKFMESDFGETLDTACDNIINVFLFGGIAWGVARNFGWGYALMPFLLLALGGFSIFALIYFPGGGKGDFFKGTPVFDVILLLASRNFIYVILFFALAGHLDWFLWLSGFGSLAFALYLLAAWMKISSCKEA